MCKQSFRDWYFESCVIYGQLIVPSTAALILGITSQHLQSLLNRKKIRRVYFDNKTFVGMHDVLKVMVYRESKLIKK